MDNVINRFSGNIGIMSLVDFLLKVSITASREILILEIPADASKRFLRRIQLRSLKLFIKIWAFASWPKSFNFEFLRDSKKFVINE
jgi:hypothetical protein